MIKSEKQIAAILEHEGWAVHHAGWPDFLCERTSRNGATEFVFVEIKSKRDRVRSHQSKFHQALKRAGFKVHVMTVSNALPTLPDGMKVSCFINHSRRNVHERQRRKIWDNAA